MKKHWKRRGFAVTTAMALAIAASGVAEEPRGNVPSDALACEAEGPQDEALFISGLIDAPVGETVVNLVEGESGDATLPDLPEDSDPGGASGGDGDLIPDLTQKPEAEGSIEGETPAEGQTPAEGETPAEGKEKPEGQTPAEGEEKPEGQTPAEGEEKSEGETAQGVAGAEKPAEIAAEAKATPEETEIVAEAADAAAKYEAAAPSSLSFPSAVVTMGKGEKLQLRAQSPENTDPSQITYTSSKPTVVKTDAAGNLIARKKGTATITATASNGVKATCKVKVVKAPSKLKLNVKKLTFGVGETRALKAKLPKGAASAITWTSNNPAVVSVDAAGNLTGVAPGKARVTARTFNGKRVGCTVTILEGRTPTSLSFPSKVLYLGLNEKRLLAPQLGPGESAVFSYKSNKKSVVTVTPGGWVKAKKKGTAKITVKTHNGLKYNLTVKVIKAPAKLTLSKTKLTLQTGTFVTLEATLPAHTASDITWVSSNPSIATVDADGSVMGIAPGTVEITAKTFNGKSVKCQVNVLLPADMAKDTPPGLTNAQMVENLRASKTLGGKEKAICNVAKMLMDAGFEPAYAAGVCANIYSEGNYGFFESSKYIANYQKRPSYFCYLDGGDYYKSVNGKYVLTAVYLSQEEYDAYTGPYEKRLRFGEEKYYWNHWSGKYIWETDLNEYEAFSDKLNEQKFKTGKFGIGIVQWTGGRTRNLLRKYRKRAGEGNPKITKEQVIDAENEQILEDLQGDYKFVYNNWKKANENARYCPEAANSAGSLICLKYEIPANKETSAVKRGKRAAEFYKIMVGLQ